jgi:hypothetical protein
VIHGNVASTFSAVLLIAFAATACGGGSKQTLTLSGEGASGQIEVEYQVSDEDTVTETVQSPWRLDVDVGGDWSIDLTVKNTTTTGLVTCALEGDAISRPVGTRGEAAAHCTAAKSGNSTSYETKGDPFSGSTESTDTTTTSTTDAAAPIERLPIDISGARRITASKNALYIPIGSRIVQYFIDSKQSQAVSLRGSEPATPADLDAVATAVPGVVFAVDVGPGAVYSSGSGFDPVATVVGAGGIVAVGHEVWVPAVGDGASNKPGIMRFDGATGKKLGVIPKYTDVLAVGPDSVVAYHGSDYALIGYDGKVSSTGSPPIGFSGLTGAFVGGKVLVGSREEGTLVLLDPETWETTPVSDEYQWVYSDGVGGAWVSDLKGRVAAFDTPSGQPGSGVTPVEGGYVAAVGANTVWMATSDGSLHAVDRSAFG